MTYAIIEWLGAILGLIGSLAISYKKIYGMYVFIVSDVLLIIIAQHNRLYGMIFLYVAFAVINVIGIRYWSKTRDG